MRKQVAFPLVWALAAGTAAAQPTTGDILVAGLGAQPTVHRYVRSGAGVKYFPALMTSALRGRIPGNADPRPYVRDVIVDHDNRAAVGVVHDQPVRWLVRFDPVTATVLGTLTNFPTTPTLLYKPYEVERDQDGGYIVVGHNDYLWKVDSQGRRVSSLNLSRSYPNFPLGYDYLVNYEDGHALLIYLYTVYRLDRLTGAITSLFANPGFTNFGPTYQMSQEYSTGKIVWGTSGGTSPTNCRGIYELDVTTPLATPVVRLGPPGCPIPNFYAAYGSRFDRQSTPNPLFFFGDSYSWSGLGAVDFSTRPPTVSRLYDLLGSFASYSLDILGSVNLTSRSLGPDRWQLDVSFPAQGGKAYLVALGLAGVHPGVPVAQRVIHLNPDPLTLVSARGELWPFLTGNLGRLDGGGRAAARLDLSRLGGALNGLPIYFVALVLDPAAPAGLAEVSDPYLILPGARY